MDPHLYDDVIPCLEWLRRDEGVKLGIFTNASAAIPPTSILGSVLDICLSAADVGAQKPSIVPFMAICQKCDINPSRVLYVGDSFLNDVIGSKLAGMSAAYLRRPGIVDDTYSNSKVEYSINADFELSSLSLEEFRSAILAYLQSKYVQPS